MTSVFRNPIVKATVGLFLMTAALKGLGYAEKIVIAYFFGTRSDADVYILVLNVILSFFFFFREVVEPVLMNMFMRSDESVGWNLFNYMLRILFGVTVCIAVLGVIFPENIINVFAPGFETEGKTLSAHVLRIAAPAILFLSLSTLTNIVFNAQKIFVFPVMGDMVFKGLSIACIIVFGAQFGIVSGAFGIVLGAIGKLGMHLTELYKKVSFSRIHVNDEDKASMRLLAWPLIIGMFFSQMTGLVDNVFASYLEQGSIAALSYAKKIVELPVLIFPYILSVVIFPFLTQLSIRKDYENSVRLLFQSLRYIAILFIPLMVYVAFFSKQIVQLIFERGAFDEHSTLLTGNALYVYSIGLLFFAADAILVIFYYANSDTKTPIYVGICCALINIATTYMMIPYFGYLSIAVAFVLQKGLKVCVLVGFLNRLVPLKYSSILLFAARIAIPLAAFTLSLVLLQFLLTPDYVGGVFQMLCFLVGSLLTGGVLYVCCLFLFGLMQIKDLQKIFHS